MKLINLLIPVLIMLSCTKEQRTPVITCTILALHHNICNGSNVAYVTVGATGGFQPYLYQLDNGIWQRSPTFLHIASGGHTVHVKDVWNHTAQVSFPVVGVSSPACNPITHQTK